jgi:Domain of unknown function (DUF4431)
MKRVFCATAALLVLFSQSSMSAECLKDGQNISLSGKISRETFPGPPNYENIDNGDKPETYWILTTDKSNCVLGESIEDGSIYEIAKSTTRFQLAFEDASVYKTQKKLVEQNGQVAGQLFAGSTGHHHTKALISVKSIKSSK